MVKLIKTLKIKMEVCFMKRTLSLLVLISCILFIFTACNLSWSQNDNVSDDKDNTGDVIDDQRSSRVLNDIIGQTGLKTDHCGQGLLLLPYSFPKVAVGMRIIEHRFALDVRLFGYHTFSSCQ
jgi:hypothetical protein